MSPINVVGRADLVTLLAAGRQPLPKVAREPAAAAFEAIAKDYCAPHGSPGSRVEMARRTVGKLFEVMAVGVRDDGIVPPAIAGLVAAFLPETR